MILKAPDRLVAIADGRLATSETAVSFDTAEKIRQFTPKYRIPRFSMGRFNNYSEMVEQDWYLAYAGSYALVSQIGDLFIKNVSGALVLTRGEGGVPRLDYACDEGGWFDDSYNFDHGELLRMNTRVIVDELLGAAQVKCDEWTGNGKDPDCQFLLFGKDTDTRRYVALKVAPDLSIWRRGEPASFQITPVDDGVVTAIGSPAVENAVARDHELQRGATGWRTDQSALGVHNLFADPEYSTWFGGEPREPIPESTPEENWTAEQVQRRVINTMLSANDKYVGGDFTAVSGVGYEIVRRTVKIV